MSEGWEDLREQAERFELLVSSPGTAEELEAWFERTFDVDPDDWAVSRYPFLTISLWNWCNPNVGEAELCRAAHDALNRALGGLAGNKFQWRHGRVRRFDGAGKELRISFYLQGMTAPHTKALNFNLLPE